MMSSYFALDNVQWVDLIVDEAIGGLQTSNNFIDNQIHPAQSSHRSDAIFYLISISRVIVITIRSPVLPFREDLDLPWSLAGSRHST
jgi:hypothetical protein